MCNKYVLVHICSNVALANFAGNSRLRSCRENLQYMHQCGLSATAELLVFVFVVFTETHIAGNVYLIF